MFVIAVANVKGGTGKTTVATNLAAHAALAGHRTVLADLDRQRSALAWLARRPASAAAIRGIDLTHGIEDLPRKAARVIIDGLAAMPGDMVGEVVDIADLIVIPVLPSAFDEDGTSRFVAQLAKERKIRKGKRLVAFVANRVRPRSHAAHRLQQYLAAQDHPVVATLRDTALLAEAAARGLSLFELAGRRAAPYAADWQPLLDFVAKAAGEHQG
ncbi:MAG: ParA family protein [Thalassobaculales bacterium]